MELAIQMGLQGAGKSTFARERFGDYEYVSKDRMPRSARHKEARQRRMIAEALAAGRSVVVDNTNPSPAVRAPLIELGRQYGALVTGYYFVPDVRGSLARNATRAGSERVPPVAIYATAKRLTAPTYAEGYDALYAVRIAPEGSFAVSAIPG